MPDCQDYHGGEFCLGRDLEFEDEEEIDDTDEDEELDEGIQMSFNM